MWKCSRKSSRISSRQWLEWVKIRAFPMFKVSKGIFRVKSVVTEGSAGVGNCFYSFYWGNKRRGQIVSISWNFRLVNYCGRNRMKDRVRAIGLGANWLGNLTDMRSKGCLGFGCCLTVPASQTYSFFGGGAGSASGPELVWFTIGF